MEDILTNPKLNTDYLFNNSHNKIMLDQFLNLATKALAYIKDKKKCKCFSYKVNKINSIADIPRSSMNDSYFFPQHIQKYIDENSMYSLEFNCKIKNREINVFFIFFNHITPKNLSIINKQIEMVYVWFYILDYYSIKECSNTVDLYVYFTPFEKKLPNNQLNILSSEHVNTGYTTGCKPNTEIVIYRKEEWFKVFIHETFHNFGLDFSDMNLSHVNKLMREIFNVNIEYNIYESYCETWARIINVMFYSYFSCNENVRDKYFASEFQKNMNYEAIHSLYQMVKILHFLDLRYDIVNEKSKDNIKICNHLYKEKSSVFSYYVITGLLLNNYSKFMYWCKKNNNILLLFKRSPGNIDKYISLIKSCSNNKTIINNIDIIEKSINKKNHVLNDSLRMTLLDMNLLEILL